MILARTHVVQTRLVTFGKFRQIDIFLLLHATFILVTRFLTDFFAIQSIEVIVQIKSSPWHQHFNICYNLQKQKMDKK